MGLDFAIDELYATGWTSLDSAACTHHAGRPYPGLDAIKREFAARGHTLAIQHIQLFDSYRAEWRDNQGHPAGAVIGNSEAEVAVYALSRLRRQLAQAMA